MKTGIVGLPQVGDPSLQNPDHGKIGRARVFESARGTHWRGARAGRTVGQALRTLFATAFLTSLRCRRGRLLIFSEA